MWTIAGEGTVIVVCRIDGVNVEDARDEIEAAGLDAEDVLRCQWTDQCRCTRRGIGCRWNAGGVNCSSDAVFDEMMRWPRMMMEIWSAADPKTSKRRPGDSGN
jgi:hypothetical protein